MVTVDVVDLCQDRPRLILYAEIVVENKCRNSNKEWVAERQLWNISKVGRSVSQIILSHVTAASCRGFFYNDIVCCLK